MRLTPGVTIDAADTVTRQTLFDVWANAGVGQVGQTDLAAEVQSMVAQASAPSEAPGKLWYDTTENLVKYYADVFDGTGVSLWLAWGPDRFDVPAFANAPAAYGAAMIFDGVDKQTKPAPTKSTTDLEGGKVVGFNEAGQTADSGTWFPMSVLGICTMWYGTVAGETPGNFATHSGQDLGVASHASTTGDGMVRVYAGTQKRGLYIGAKVFGPEVQIDGTFKGLFHGPSRQKLS